MPKRIVNRKTRQFHELVELPPNVNPIMSFLPKNSLRGKGGHPAGGIRLCPYGEAIKDVGRMVGISFADPLSKRRFCGLITTEVPVPFAACIFARDELKKAIESKEGQLKYLRAVRQGKEEQESSCNKTFSEAARKEAEETKEQLRNIWFLPEMERQRVLSKLKKRKTNSHKRETVYDELDKFNELAKLKDFLADFEGEVSGYGKVEDIPYCSLAWRLLPVEPVCKDRGS